MGCVVLGWRGEGRRRGEPVGNDRSGNDVNGGELVRRGGWREGEE